jgi:hypothetical protein
MIWATSVGWSNQPKSFTTDTAVLMSCEPTINYIAHNGSAFMGAAHFLAIYCPVLTKDNDIIADTLIATKLDIDAVDVLLYFNRHY